MNAWASDVARANVTSWNGLFEFAAGSVAALSAEKEIWILPMATPLVTSCDRVRVSQLLVILLRCAIHDSAPRGRIVLEAEAAATGLKIHVFAEKSLVSPRQLASLFARFRGDDVDRAELYDRPGLQVTLAVLITRLLGGALNVLALEGAGTRFELDLPG